MTQNTLQARRIEMVLDPTSDGRILLIAIDEDLGSTVLRFTPAEAARLAHALLDMAKRLEHP